jgi:hypothetical protein
MCAYELTDGKSCRATPLRDEPYCFWHSPDHAEEAAEARRLGGLRRRRERAITTVYELDGLGTVDGIRRVLDIAVADALGLENSVARSRVLIAAVMAATRLLEIGGFEGIRLEHLADQRELLRLPVGDLLAAHGSQPIVDGRPIDGDPALFDEVDLPTPDTPSR